MAVAGFSPAELDITVQENTLLVTGKAQKEDGTAAATCTVVSPGVRLSGALALPTT